MEGLSFRMGRVEDAEVLAHHRCEMFREMGILSAEGYRDLKAASVRYFRESLPSGNYVAWLVCEGEKVVAGGGMQLNTIPPRPGPNGDLLAPGPQGLIVNIYVEPDWRRNGIANELVRRMIDHAGSNGVASLNLHASEAGRGIYERLGFKPTSEMKLYL